MAFMLQALFFAAWDFCHPARDCAVSVCDSTVHQLQISVRHDFTWCRSYVN